MTALIGQEGPVNLVSQRLDISSPHAHRSKVLFPIRRHGDHLADLGLGIRRDGSQPAASGTNQHVRYFKPDIVAWRNRGKVSSTMQAAKLKGQVFATIFDLAETHAFYIDPADGGVAGMVEHTHIETVIARLGSWEIVWMPATEAASQRWSNLAAHQELAGKIQSVLSNMQQGIAAALEASEVSECVPQPTPPRAGRTPGGPL